METKYKLSVSKKNKDCSTRSKDKENVSLLNSDGPNLCQKLTSHRWKMAYILCVMTLLIFCLKNCMSMALVCIQGGNCHRLIDSNRTEFEKNCLDELNIDTSFNDTLISQNSVVNDRNNNREGKIDSEEKDRSNVNVSYITKVPISADEKGQILASFFYGYSISPFISSYLFNRFGLKRIVSASMILNVGLIFVTPSLLMYDITLTCVSRAIVGFLSWIPISAAPSIWSHWAPHDELASLSILTFTGISSGNVFTSFASGVLCSIPIKDSWMLIFYLFGGIEIMWLLIWQVFVYEQPCDHPTISSSELEYIEQHRKSNFGKFEKQIKKEHDNKRACSNSDLSNKYYTLSRSVVLDENYMKVDKKKETPWKSILTSKPVYALMIAFTAYNWTINCMAQFIPFLLHQKLGFNVQTTATLWGVQFSCRLVAGLIFAFVIDYITTHQWISITTLRKICHSIGLGMHGILMLILAFFELTPTYSVILVCVAGFFHGANTPRLNHIDLSPKFVDTLISLTGIVSNLIGYILSTVILAILTDNDKWTEALVLTGGVSVFGAVVYISYGSGEKQSWDEN